MRLIRGVRKNNDQAQRTNEVSFTLRRKEMEMMNETIAGKPEKADDIISNRVLNCTTIPFMSPFPRF